MGLDGCHSLGNRCSGIQHPRVLYGGFVFVFCCIIWFGLRSCTILVSSLRAWYTLIARHRHPAATWSMAYPAPTAYHVAYTLPARLATTSALLQMTSVNLPRTTSMAHETQMLLRPGQWVEEVQIETKHSTVQSVPFNLRNRRCCLQ